MFIRPKDPGHAVMILDNQICRRIQNEKIKPKHLRKAELLNKTLKPVMYGGSFLSFAVLTLFLLFFS